MYLNKKQGLFVALILIFVLSACNKQDEESRDGERYEVTERKEIELTEMQVEYIQLGNTLAVDFIQTIVKKPGLVRQKTDRDFFVSPLGLEYLLGLLYCGATGDGADEILSVFRISKEDGTELNEYLSSLTSQLKMIDPLVTFSSANLGLINKNNYELKDDYVSLTKEYYDAEVTSEDFNDCDNLTRRLNMWCYEKTAGMIPYICPINPWDNFVLFNALYFNGVWKARFDKEKSCNEIFTKRDGSTITVSMMKQEGTFGYKKDSVFSLACLPYGNGAYQMYVLLPEEGFNTEDVIDRLKDLSWNTVTSSIFPMSLEIWLPAFESSSFFDVTPVLYEMGLRNIIKPGNLDRLAKEIYADKVIQRTLIRVSEEGTEAAAITGAMMDGGGVVDDSIKPRLLEFHADKPFIYIITEQSSGAILYAGRFAGEPDIL